MKSLKKSKYNKMNEILEKEKPYNEEYLSKMYMSVIEPNFFTIIIQTAIVLIIAIAIQLLSNFRYEAIPFLMPAISVLLFNTDGYIGLTESSFIIYYLRSKKTLTIPLLEIEDVKIENINFENSDKPISFKFNNKKYKFLFRNIIVSGDIPDQKEEIKKLINKLIKVENKI